MAISSTWSLSSTTTSMPVSAAFPDAAGNLRCDGLDEKAPLQHVTRVGRWLASVELG
jgi:hypothetical protein